MALLLGSLAAQPADPLQESQRLIREKQYEEAVAVLNRAKLETPSDARLFFYSGLALMESGQLRQAGPEFRRAIELDPSPPEFPLLYAELQERLGQKGEASKTLELFESQAAVGGLDPPELWLLTNLYLRLDAFSKALWTLDRFEALNAPNAETSVKRGDIYLNQRNFKQAAECYQRALDDPTHGAAASYGLALSRWNLGNPVEAKPLLLSALERDPQNVEYRYHLGRLALDLQEPEEALRYLKPLEKLGDDFPGIYNALARAYRRTGKLALSREYFEKFGQAEAREKRTQTDARLADSLVRRGLDRVQAGDLKGARTLFEEALQREPSHWTARKQLAQIYLNSQAWNLAWDQLSAMETMRPEDFDVKSLLAWYWHDRSQPLQARPYAEAARRLNPGDAELRNLLGNIYLSLGLRQEARQEYLAAVALAPERPDFRLNLESVSEP